MLHNTQLFSVLLTQSQLQLPVCNTLSYNNIQLSEGFLSRRKLYILLSLQCAPTKFSAKLEDKGILFTVLLLFVCLFFFTAAHCRAAVRNFESSSSLLQKFRYFLGAVLHFVPCFICTTLTKFYFGRNQGIPGRRNIPRVLS